MRKKIGILGGTFNPIHIGHLLLAQYAFEQAELAKIIFIPSGVSYMKQDIPILPAKDRMRLVELSIQYHSCFEVSDMEILRPGNTYTYETLEELKRKQDNHYYFILGADSVFSMEKWKEPARIFKSCTILAAVRETTDKERLRIKTEDLKQKFGADIMLLDFPRIDISSSEIRERLKLGKSIHHMVAPEAEEYIYKNQLFKR